MNSNSFDDLKLLLSINTRTTDDLGKPNVTGIRSGIDFIKKLCADLPLNWFEVVNNNASPLVYCESRNFDSSKPVILLSTHLDTVYSPSDVENKETEDKLYGSGAQDMKVSLYIVIGILKKLLVDNKLKNIIWCISPEEETATLNYRNEIEELAKRASYALVFESTLDREPEAPLNKRSIVISRRGFQQFDLEIKNGPGGHSGVLTKKEERHNAIQLAAEIVQKLETFSDYEKETTLNVGRISGGDAINILAPSAKISFETRFRSNQEHLRIVNLIESLVEYYNPQNIFELELKSNRFYPPFQINEAEAQFIQICKQQASSLDIELIEEIRGGGSEASLIKYFNPNCAVLDGFGPRGEGQHTKSEFVWRESIGLTLNYTFEVIKNLL
jgi:glutamate carboxypeptidase